MSLPSASPSFAPAALSSVPLTHPLTPSVLQAKLGEDPHQGGLVLEWVYGSIVSTAEKAR